MAIRFDDYLAKLPEEQRQAVDARAAVLIAEETLRQSRQARRRSQEEMARKLQTLRVGVAPAGGWPGCP